MSRILGEVKAIIHPARIQICQICRYHGHIILPDGTVDVEVASKNDFRIRIALLLEREKIGERDRAALENFLSMINLVRLMTKPYLTDIQRSVKNELGSKADRCVQYLDLFLSFVR
jgi:hypothetical protein